MGFKPVCCLFSLLAKCGQGGVINSVIEMFPSFRCICISQASKGFLKQLGKFLHFSLIASLADVNTWSSFLFRVLQSFCSQFYYTHTISILVTACDRNTMRARTSSEDQIRLMPMLGSWMSPGNSGLKLRIKERVADTKTIIKAKLQQVLAIFVHLPNAKTA